MQPYEYKPLPTASSIRILILYPATDAAAPLEVNLLIRDRMELLQDPDNETFDAVSYVWGNGAHTLPLYCRSESTYLRVSAVVDEMLRSLRKDSKERRLWVDAVCLNQKDDQEKSVQVQRMGQIYHMANKVQIWLGPALPSVPFAFALLRTLVAKYEPTPGEARYPTTEEILDTSEETCGDHGLESVLYLLNQPWFTRRWTLQEGFLARHAIVRCGSSKIPWYWFTEGLRLIHNKARVIEILKNDSGALYALNILEALREPADLLSRMWKLHQSQCSNPRDKIYALLALVQKMEPIPLHGKVIGRIGHSPEYQVPLPKAMPTPDYTLSEEGVFRGFVNHCIWADRFLQIVCHIDAFGSLSEVNPEWPSWVPKWTGTRSEKRHSPAQMSKTVPASHCIDKHLYCQMENPPYDLGDKWSVLDEFIYPRPTEFLEDDLCGLIIYGDYHESIVEIFDSWPETTRSDDLVRYLANWIIKNLSWSELENPYYSVIESLLLLITGTHFFGYANHSFLRDVYLGCF